MIVPISKVRFRRDEDGVWIAKSPLLPGCHAHGRDRGEAALRFQEAAKAHLEALLETGRPIPEAFRDKFILAANFCALPAAIATIQIRSSLTG